MKIPPSLKSGLLDVLMGFLGLVLLLILDFRTDIKFDLRWFFIVGALFCCVLGVLRGEGPPRNPWLKGVLIISGFSVPLLTLSLTGMALGADILVAFLLVSSLSICCGVLARRTWARDRRMASVTFLLLPLGCVVLASISLLPPLMGKLSGQHVNTPAPEFSLTTEEGKILTSPELRGKVVVLAFWATWCEPCWQELPKVEKVYTSYKDNRAVLFWAVNARAGGDTDEIARAFAKKMRLGLPVAYTENANAIRLGVDGYPTLVLLDAAGHVRFIHNGYDGSERLEPNLAHEIAILLDQGS
ncbi:MAG: TlpA family protein disulfide reductase [Terriglobia bacterium]